MGNEASNKNKNKKSLIWIDADINSNENMRFYNTYLSKNFKANKFKSIHEGIEFLKQTQKFTSIILIISGNLYKEFYFLMSKNKKEIKFCIIVIVYLRNEYLFKQNLKIINMYQKDNFLSPKYITSNIVNLKNFLENKNMNEKEFTFENIENII